MDKPSRFEKKAQAEKPPPRNPLPPTYPAW
jgi:hypothetical protein